MKYDEHTDNRYLGLTFDTQSGIDVLKALLGLGRDKVSVRLMLSFALSKIEHRREKLEKMKQLLQIKDSISVSSLYASDALHSGGFFIFPVCGEATQYMKP